MAIVDEDQVEGAEVRHCPDCGQPATRVHYCRDCGHVIDVGANGETSTAERTATRPQEARSTAPAHRRILPIALAVVLVVAIAVVMVVLLSGSSSDQGKAYRQKLTNALAPLTTANRALSSSLQGLHGHGIQAAVTATNRNVQTLLAARAGVAALPVPHSASALSRQTQRALAQENAYLQAVSAILANPASPSVSAVQGLASATVSAFAALAAVAPGAGTSIYGAGSLVRWAQGLPAAHKSASLAAGRTAVQQPGSAALSARGNLLVQPGANTAPHNASSNDFATPSGAPVPGYWSLDPAPYAQGVGAPYAWAGGTSCDQNIFAGDNTSCSFADNIFKVVAAGMHYSNVIPASVITYDPGTGTTYTLACTEYWGTDNQSDLQCITGYGTGTAFPVWAANVYYG